MMCALPARVVALVQTQFQPDDRPVALELLQRYGHAPHEMEHERVWLALLDVSEGSIDKLREAVELARTDYRDVLLWAEDQRSSAITPGKRWAKRAIAWIRSKLSGGP
jgi:hypothetical protein